MYIKINLNFLRTRTHDIICVYRQYNTVDHSTFVPISQREKRTDQHKKRTIAKK